MQINSDNIHFLVGNADILNRMCMAPVLPMFSEQAVRFLSELSKRILQDKRTRSYADVTSYAYWIRRASLEQARAKHTDYEKRLGRGIAFHIAPSNVPVNFAVSMTSSLLAGNLTVIRVSNKQFPQVEIITDAINALLEQECADFQPYVCIIRYEHSDGITRELSAVCDLRVIWGGDHTIEAIRRAPLPPRAIEMSFADRYSVAVIDADAYLKEDAESVAKGFYTDTYYTDQNACSSPRLVVWMGEQVDEARGRFWDALGTLVRRDYDMKPIQAVDKYTTMCALAMLRQGNRLVSDDNYIVRIETDTLSAELMSYRNAGGYFFEYRATELAEIVPVLTKQCQTISVLGVEKQAVRELVFQNGVRGVDRIVPLGQTMGLEFVWDGYKMIENMTRIVYQGEP